MKKIIYYIALACLPFLIKAQVRLNFIQKMMMEADSVAIVSHETTDGIVDDKTGKLLPLQKLIINRKLNNTIIHENKRVQGESLKLLSQIISRPFEDAKIEIGMCFIPHHAIIIFKGKKTSFFDVCFECHRFIASKDIGSIIEHFDNCKWDDLFNFFKQQGFKYELL